MAAIPEQVFSLSKAANRGVCRVVCAVGLLSADALAWLTLGNLGERILADLPLLTLAAAWMGWMAFAKRSYTRRDAFWMELRKVVLGVLLVALLVGFYSMYVLKALQWSALLYLMSGVFVLVPLARFVARQCLTLFGVWERPALVFGTGENAVQAALALQSEKGLGYCVKGFVQPDGLQEGAAMPLMKLDWPATEDEFSRLRDHHCIIALEADQADLRDHLIRQLSKHGVTDVHVVPAMRGVPLYGLDTSQFFSHEVLMIHVRNQLAKPLLRVVKRLFDICGSLALLALLSPLFAVLAWKVSRDGGSPFFGHERVGQGGRKFKCYKFRSMVINAQQVLQELLERDPVARAEWDRDFKLKNDPRVNRVGHFLRRTSLDELPQLWNVLKGEMSLVGPRPVVEAELPRYGEDVSYYLMVKPGMTGLWQVSGRNDVDYDTRVYFDAWYVKNWSLWTDIAILFKTVGVVFGRSGAY